MRIGAAVAVLALAIGCAGGSRVSGDLRSVGSVTVTFTVTPSSAKVGQPVRVAFRVLNNAGTVEQLTFGSGQRYEFWATQGEREVWRWSRGQVFIQEVTHEEIPSGNSVTYAEVWTPDRAGQYVVHGELKAEGYAGAMTGKLDVS